MAYSVMIPSKVSLPTFPALNSVNQMAFEKEP